MAVYESIDRAAYPGVSLKFWLLGTIIASVAYGMVFCLFLACMSKFVQLKIPDGRPDRFRVFLVAYAFGMLFLSTLAFLSAVVATVNLVLPTSQGLNKSVTACVRFGDACSLVLTCWLSDGLMIWRCIVIYQGISKRQRIFLIACLSTLAFLSAASGTFFVVSALKVLNKSMMTFAGLTAGMNIVITGLIVLRLWRHQRYVQGTLGSQYGSDYTGLMHMFVESAALVVVFNLVHLALISAPNNTLLISHQLLVHVYVISTLLILFRVAQGKLRASSPGEEDYGTQIWFAGSSHLDESPELAGELVLTPATVNTIVSLESLPRNVIP